LEKSGGPHEAELTTEVTDTPLSHRFAHRSQLKGLPIFLFGISMGGATALRLSENNPDRYTGMVTFAPMCSLEKVRKQPIKWCIKNKVRWDE